MLIVEDVKDDSSDHRGHLAMAMKSTLAVYRMYQMTEEVVFGLLVDREHVSLCVAWNGGEGEYIFAKVSSFLSDCIDAILNGLTHAGLRLL